MIFKLQFQYLLVGCLLSVTCICQELRKRIFQGRPECGFDEGSVFQGSVFQAIPGISRLECADRCTKDGDCKSTNYEKKTGTCQLSNTTAPTCGALTALANHTYLEKRHICENNGVWISEDCGCRCPIPYRGITCQNRYPVSPPVNQIGNPVLPYPGVLGPYVQIFLNHVIPADTNIVSVSYLLKASGGVSFLSIWRPDNTGKYTYISKSPLLNNTAGYHKHNLACPLEVKEGDIIGIHNGQVQMKLAICDNSLEGTTYPCSSSVYSPVKASGMRDSGLVEGRTYSLNNNSVRIYALQVHFV